MVEDDVFLGPNSVLANDHNPRAWLVEIPASVPMIVNSTTAFRVANTAWPHRWSKY